jgi:ATP-dependent RNA helicase RhlE
LTPTRELALQIDENFREYSKGMGISHFALFGGIKQHSQVRKLEKGVDVLIATPGRLLDLMQQGFISLKHIETLILDEADNMLNMGFINDIKKVLKTIPTNRQTLFFSATMPKEILSLANTILRNPKHVEVAPVSSTVDKIKQEVYHVGTG